VTVHRPEECPDLLISLFMVFHVLRVEQGRNEVKWCHGAGARSKSGPPNSSLRSLEANVLY